MCHRTAVQLSQVIYCLVFRKHIIKGSATKLLGRFRRTFSNHQESELVCITRPVSSLWHGWSSYSAWPFTVSVRYSWISHRLDSVVHHESLVDCQLRRWRVDRVCCCHLRRAPSQRSGIHALSFIYCWFHKNCIALWSERSFICRRLYVHCDAVNCAAEAPRLAACIDELDG